MKCIHIVLISSNDFSEYCATTMASILYNVSEEYIPHFYILSFDMKNKNKRKIEKLKKIKPCSIEYKQFDEKLLDIFDGIKIPPHVSKMTYARILIPDILPDVDKAIFIDSDTIVRADISALYEKDMKNKYFAMVEDANWKNLSLRLYGIECYYFNTGVMLVNLSLLRNIGYLNLVKRHINLNRYKYQICDQDVLNDTFRENILRLDITWNCYHKIFAERFHCYIPDNVDTFNKTCNNPNIVHFVGPEKPWLPDVSHQFKDEFQFYNKLTCFYRYSKIKNIKKLIIHSKERERIFILRVFGIPVLKKKNDPEKQYIKLIGLPIYYKRIKCNTTNNVLRLKIDTLITQMENQQELNQLISRKLSNIKCIIEAQKLHEKTFSTYKNAFYGKDVVLVCTGPTARMYKMRENAIHVGVNGAIYLDNIQLDYLFVQDYTIHQPNNETLVEDIIKYRGNNCKKFFGIIPDERLEEVHNAIERIPLRLASQKNVSQYLLEDLKMHNIAYDLSREPLGDFSGTVFSALQFILYTHPKRLYLVGFDCNAGYAYNKNNYGSPANYQIDILKRYFLPFIKINYQDIEIISVNPVGLRGIFQDIYMTTYRLQHPELKI